MMGMGMMSNVGRRVRSLVIAVAIGVASLGLSQHSHAQFGMMGIESEMGDMLKPAVSTRMLKQYGDMLSLSDDQKRAAEELLTAYQGDFRDAVDRLKEVYQAVQEEMEDTGDWEVYQDALPTAMIKFVRKADKLNKGLMDDLRSLLSGPQAEKFPAFERALRRKSAIKIGFDGMQKVDLSEMVGNLGLESAAWSNVATVLGPYELELDAVMVAHTKLMRDFLEEMVTDMEDGKKPYENPEKMTKVMMEFQTNAKKIGEINDKFVRQIEPQLPEAKQKDFQRELQLTKYPMVYKRSVASRIIEAAEKIPDLDAGQREGLNGIKEAYRRDAEASNSKWAAVIDEVRSSSSGDMGMGGGGIWMLRQNEKYQEAQNARKALDTKTIDSVKALLNDEQKKKLPNAMKRPEFDFDAPLGTK